mmetsp:Transcript_115392/g.230098  ORF Transcript_115392/g.230098 Transcript_115392/m.230098 type:complete len:299 (-) Transcript_115392:270-1166(-)
MHSQEVITDDNLAAYSTSCTNPNHWDTMHRRLNSTRHFGGHTLNHNDFGTCHSKRLCISNNLECCLSCCTLELQAALQERMLWFQAYVTHHCDACTRERLHQWSHTSTSFKFHHVGTSHTKRCCVLKGFVFDQIGAKRHVANNDGLGAVGCSRRRGCRCINAPPYGRNGSYHVFHGDAHRVRQAKAAITEAVTDQNQFHTSPASHSGRGKIVSGDHCKLTSIMEAFEHSSQTQRTGSHLCRLWRRLALNCRNSVAFELGFCKRGSIHNAINQIVVHERGLLLLLAAVHPCNSGVQQAA